VAVLIFLSVPILLHRADWQYKSFLPLALPFFFSGITSRMLFEKKFPYLAIVATGIATLGYWAVLGFWAYRLLLPVAFVWLLFLIITAREAGAFRLRWGWLDRVCWLIALNPVMTALGRVSYSTYLCHIPLFALIVGGGMTLTGRQDQQIVIALTLFSMALTVPVSFLLYHYVEKPGVRLGNRWVRRRPADELAAA
jgi:peptidoglycan/LPS O-acetylase OafA/YrhL